MIHMNIDNVLYLNCTMYRSVTSNKPNNISSGSDAFFEVDSLIGFTEIGKTP
jgi:hypothetical protein